MPARRSTLAIVCLLLAAVALSFWWTATEVRSTVADGRQLQAGEVTTTRAEPTATQAGRQQVEPGAPAETVPPNRRRIRGRVVRRRDDSPVRDAVVELRCREARGRVEPSGHFRVSGLRPGRHYWLYVCGRTYGSRLYALPTRLGDDQRHDMGTLVLRPEGSVAGRVVDTEGNPRAGVRVTLRGTNADARSRLAIKRPSAIDVLEQQRSRTDDRGAFFFPGVAAGSYQVIARNEGSRRETRTTVTAEDGRTHHGPDLVLDAGTVIAGRLHPPVGQTLAGLRLWLRASNVKGSRAEARTDAAGRFRFTGLDKDLLHSITVFRRRGRESLIPRPVHRVHGGTTDLRLDLEPGVRICGRVVDQSGTPCRAWVQTVRKAADGQPAARSAATQLTSDAGEFEIYVLGDFVGSLTASSIPGSPAGHATARLDGVRAGQLDLELRLRPRR